MCFFDPISMFAVATLASTAMSVTGNIMQGNQAAAAGKAQQAAYQQHAEADRVASGYEATREFEKGRRVTAHGITQVAASGVGVAGSPMEALIENEKQNQLDIEAIRFGSKIRQNQLKTQGDLALFKGQQGQQAGYIGAATAAVTGIANLYNPNKAVKVGAGSNIFAGLY